MLILRLSKREDQALIPISTILNFSAQLSFYFYPKTVNVFLKRYENVKIMRKSVSYNQLLSNK